VRNSVFTAAELGDLSTLLRLEESIRSSKPVDGTGYTPLHYAAQQGHQECVQFLLDRCKVDVDASACGATALHRAAFAGQLSCVRLLLAAGANVDLQDTSFGDERTALHKAASRGHVDVVKALLASGADINIADAEGATAARVAVGSARELLEAALASSGAKTPRSRVALAPRDDDLLSRWKGWRTVDVLAREAAAAEETGRRTTTGSATPLSRRQRKPDTPALGATCDGCGASVLVARIVHSRVFCEACARQQTTAAAAAPAQPAVTPDD